MRLDVTGVLTHVEIWDPIATDATTSTVLLLHGNPDSARLWHPVLRRLRRRHANGSSPADGLRFVAPDLPGFGRSLASADFVERLGRSTLSTFSRWVDGVLDAVEQSSDPTREPGPPRSPIHLVAHDFGGPYGFAWAVDHPARVRSLAGIDTIFFAEYRWHFWARVWRTRGLGEISMPFFCWPIFRLEMRRGSKGLDEQELRRTWEFVGPRTKRMVLDLYRATDPEIFDGAEQRLRRLMGDRPSLALWGADDPYIDPSWAFELGARRVIVVDDRGHWLPLEAPDLVADRLGELFAER